MPSADKRARKKENARAARVEREAAEKRRKRIRSTTTVAVVGAVFIGLVVILNVAGNDKKKATPPATTPPTVTTTTQPLPAGCDPKVPEPGEKQTYDAPPEMTIDTAKTYVAHFSTTCGDFDVTLDPKVAPKTVNSFLFLARNKFYDGLKFHRVADDFVIQGGDPAGDGSGGPGYELPDEPPPDGYQKGSVAMANGGAGTTGSQFFVVATDNGAKGLEQLGGPPYHYSALGKVTKGFPVVEKMMTLAQGDGPPAHPLYMFKVTITES